MRLLRWRPASRWGRFVTRRHNLCKCVEQVEAGPPIMREQFGRIQRISFNRSFDECVALVGDFLDSLRETEDAPQTAREMQRQ